jgi:hypothetical protein
MLPFVFPNSWLDFRYARCLRMTLQKPDHDVSERAPRTQGSIPTSGAKREAHIFQVARLGSDRPAPDSIVCMATNGCITIFVSICGKLRIRIQMSLLVRRFADTPWPLPVRETPESIDLPRRSQAVVLLGLEPASMTIRPSIGTGQLPRG